MLKQFNLSQRVKLTFVCSFILLSLVSMVLVFAAIKNIEDYIFERQLEHEINKFQRAKKLKQPITLPNEISYFPSKNHLPANIAPYVHQNIAGTYELDHPNEIDIHYALIPDDNDQLMVFLYDVTSIELSEELERQTFLYILLGFTILLTLFFVIFKWILERSLAPMHQLIEQVNTQAKNPDQEINYQYSDDDELGLLHKTIESYSQRLKEFVQREREFSAFASHELRTPVTIIKGATELLAIQQTETTSKPLDRIIRAVYSMESTIELLLNLSREQNSTSPKQTYISEIFSFIYSSFIEKAHFQNKKFAVNGDLSSALKVAVIPAEIIIANIIRNAIQHSSSSDISINLNGESITVVNAVDTGSPIDRNVNSPIRSSEKGYGLGRVIAKRICDKYQWDFNEKVKDSQYIVQVKFTN